ncbi:hypothetical protein FJ941_14055 [Mesorhizobium sp. B2-3-13]|uniref:hypothetical protein n=1 Tax=Mesorhizobium sp. B2-3-13 TaxID=2589951 RepID=UPI0011280492|nr:hypothetical protein [Mesorhizobium sp. B2-3-13]TPL82004.1 hypothetical protein FJ941_14055 [Mesorhizobium sp. B2-3-13]
MRFLFVALFMVLATHVRAQEAQGVAAEAPSQQEGKGGKANDAQGNPSASSIPVRIIESPEETQRTRDREATSDKHESDDLKAQQEAAQAAGRSATAANRQVDAAWWQVGVGIAGIIAILVTIGFTIRATNAAVRSADLAEKAIHLDREMGEIQTRAYLAVTGGTAIFRGSMEPEVFIKVRNGGNSPAFNVTANYQRNNAVSFDAKPTGGRVDGVVSEHPVAKIIGANIENEYSIGIFSKIDNAKRPGIVGGFGFYLEGVLEYQTVFDIKSGSIDMDTTFLFLFGPDKALIEKAIQDGKELRFQMKLMPAFVSGWIVDYRRIMKSAREKERRDEQGAKKA